jgi:F-type H+-transporting ATPase subunit b
VNYEAIAQWSQVVSAIAFLGAMVWIWVKFIQPAVLTAQQAQNERIKEAELHRDQAKQRLDSLQGEIGSAQGEASTMKDRALAQGQREHDVIVAEARDAGERQFRNAQGELDRARVAARDRLRAELADKALDVAAAEAAQRVDAGVNAQLVNAFVSNLERGK